MVGRALITNSHLSFILTRNRPPQGESSTVEPGPTISTASVLDFALRR